MFCFCCEPTRVKFFCAFAPHKTANLDFSGTKRPAAHVLRMKDLKNIEMHLLLWYNTFIFVLSGVAARLSEGEINAGF